jgi:hypothetical protein
MLVSTSHNFVFIHIAKNGGTSLRKLLTGCSLPGRPRTAWTNFLASLPVRQRPENIAYPPHQNARWARRKLGPAFYDNAFSFAFVRNPYDRAVSRYEFIRQTPGHHQHKRFQKMGFAGFVKDEKMRNLFKPRTQLSEVSDRAGRIIVTNIYRIEAFEDGVRDICARLEIAPPDVALRQNTSQRSAYRDYFTPEIKKDFDKIYRCDVDAFGYRF